MFPDLLGVLVVFAGFRTSHNLLGVLFLFAGLSCYTQPHSNKDHVQIERSLVLRRVLATEAVCHASKDPHRLQSLPTGHEKWVPHRDLLF